MSHLVWRLHVMLLLTLLTEQVVYIWMIKNKLDLYRLEKVLNKIILSAYPPFFLFYDLFINAASTSGCIALNGRKIGDMNSKGCGRKWLWLYLGH
jgi:hypothetical protein